MAATVIWLVKLIVIGFAGISAVLYLFQSKMIFFPQKLVPECSDSFQDREISLKIRGVSLHGWFINKPVSPDRPLIIYYGGNAEEVSCNLADLGRIDTDAFLFMNYRGYGKSQGSPGEPDLLSDALAIYDEITTRHGISSDCVVLMGRSLGTGVATYVASQRPVAGVILVTPFDSLVNVAKKHYPVFPVALLLRHRFDSLSLAPSITAPMLALVASRDEIIPERCSMNLVNAWGGSSRARVMNGAGHNDISMASAYWQAINSFLTDRQR